MVDLESRALLFQVMGNLEQWRSTFFDAGYQLKVGQAYYFLGQRGASSTPFMHLREEFYKGVYKRIEDERDAFERAFAFMVTYPEFVKTLSGSRMRDEALRSAQITEAATMETMLKGPDLLARAMNVELDYDSIMTIRRLNLAGANLLYHFEEREELTQYRSEISLERARKEHGTVTIIQQFKDILDEILLMGKIPLIQPIGSLDKVFRPEEVREFLTIISQNPERFVRRFAEIYEHKLN